MRASIRKAMKHDDDGFTLIELLVVMIIIGILAGIAIPVFMEQQKKAKIVAVKSDVSNIGKNIATYYVDGNGTAADAALVVANSAATITTSDGKTITVRLSDPAISKQAFGMTNSTTWCVALQQANVTTGWRYSASKGLEEGTCTGDAPTP